LDLKQIKQIIDLMKRSELTEFAVEEEGIKLKIRRGLSFSGSPAQGGESHPVYQVTAPAADAQGFGQNAAAQTLNAPKDVEKDDPDVIYIKSPMVGTFYRSPSPESKPFAEIGTKTTETSAVCIIEAMKIMNEIQAEVKGTVTEVLVENGQPVEYGQKLFRLKKA
jgi:acetyl-CoA carboxylase biotin carboxyl carrier protein